jgi:hypothetical protein
MYSQLISGIKTFNTKHTSLFKSEVGTRQECNLNPWMLNLYINELPTLICKTSGSKVRLGDNEVPLLMHADYTVISNYSAAGIQKCLDLI